MIRTIAFLLLLSVSTFSNKIMAQNSSKSPCQEKEYKQFDFWLGNWKVYDTKGKLIGTNNIVKLTNACGMQENWISKTSSSKGTSYNYYNKSDNSWNQVWIDNSGFSLELKGNYTNNKMILKSKLVNGKKGNFYHRITWTNNPDGSVTQIWDYISPQGTIIQEAFRGNYKK